MEKSISETNEFVISPFKISISVLIQVFTELKPTCKKHEIGQFCLLVIRLIQGLDLNYVQFMEIIKGCEISELIFEKVSSRMKSITNDGIGSLIDLINSIKIMTSIHKSSILGLFVRKMALFFDKLGFTSVVRLYEDFVEFTSTPMLNLHGQCLFKAEIDVKKDKEDVLLNTKICSKQMQYFISKQIKLIQVNEKQAMNPRKVYELLKAIELQNKEKLNPVSIQNLRKKSDLNDINFLRYLNSLRVNEYLGAKESLFAYFDGQSPQTSRCWAALNLAIFHSHFNHLQLALEALKECISVAQEANDEKCLENALLWIATIIMKQNYKSCEDEDILSLLVHLQKKALKLELYHLAAIATLHFEKLTGLQPIRKGFDSSSLVCVQGLSVNADVLAVKHSLTDILMMTYGCRSAHFALIGASKLNFLMAQCSLHLHTIETIGNETVYHVNESSCIAIRNVALYLWKHLAVYEMSRDLLRTLGSSLFSEYNSKVNCIWKQALAEIEFERHLYAKDWKSAMKAIDVIKVFDVCEAKCRLAELKWKQNEKLKSFAVIDELLKDDRQRNILTPFSKVRILLLKSVLLNNISVLLEALQISKLHNLKGLEVVCNIEYSRQMLQLGQTEHALRLLHSLMIQLLADGTCRDIANAFYLQATCLKEMADVAIGNERGQHAIGALKSNAEAIKRYKAIGDKEALKNSYTLQAHVCNLINNREERNHYALLSRHL